MFKDCSIMVMQTGESSQVLRLEMDAETQQEICATFSTETVKSVKDKAKIPFDGSYKPNDDECLTIGNFSLPPEIEEAIRNPIGVTAYRKERKGYPDIKAIFVGKCITRNKREEFEVAFQCFRKEQHLSMGGFNLYLTKNTFRHERNFGISISNKVDCFYSNGDLQFPSFYFARRVFDLNPFYRSAQDVEVDQFTANERLLVQNPQKFKLMADAWIRRKIAMINDSGVLKDHSAAEIKELGDVIGIKIDVKDQKIVIPDDKEQLKVVLGFLDEEVYKGPFSNAMLLANSKRRI